MPEKLKNLKATHKAQALRARFKPLPGINDGPRLDRLYTTLQPGSELVIDFGLAYGLVTITYPLAGNPSARIELRDRIEPVGRVEFERVEVEGQEKK